VEVVDDEAVAREEDELGVSVQGAADQKQVGRRGPAVAGGRGERRMSTAAETAASRWYAIPIVDNVRIAAAESATIVVLGRAVKRRRCTECANYLVAAALPTPCNLLPRGYKVGVLQDMEA
jgi:hypothetical protein